MKISIKRSGGYAGLSEELVSLDTQELDTALAQKVEGLISRANFFSLPATVAGQSLGADFLKYEITVADRGQEHSVAFNEDNSPSTVPLSNLVREIQRLQSKA